MSNWVDVHLDVLASSPEEINQIEGALQQPCDELIAWRAQLCEKNPQEIAADVKEVVSFKPIRNLGSLGPSVNRARRFEGLWKDRYWGPCMESCAVCLAGLSDCSLPRAVLG
jgi:hypothetical protein